MLRRMAETDPFGRAKGEDPLAEMGWTDSAGIDPTAASDVAAPEQPDQAARREARAERVALKSEGGRRSRMPLPRMVGVPSERRRSNAGCAFTVVVFGFLIAVFAVVVPAVITAIDEADVTEPGPFPQPVVDEPAPSEPVEREGRRERRQRPARPRRPPQGLERASLLRRGNLAPALRRLRRVTKSNRVNLIRIDAQSVIVTVSLRGGRSRLARATWDGGAHVVSTSPGGASTRTFSWSQIDSSAPNRVVRAATRGRSSRAFNYLVLIDATGLRWSAFLKGGASYSAAPDGSAVTRVGG
jgi:hypothetical protein